MTNTEGLSGSTEGERTPAGDWNVRMRTLSQGQRLFLGDGLHGCALGLEEADGRDVLGLMEGKGHGKGKE